MTGAGWLNFKGFLPKRTRFADPVSQCDNVCMRKSIVCTAILLVVGALLPGRAAQQTPAPTATDTVVCNYRGALLDNTEFDSSFKRGQPATFQVGQVIKGWTEALQLMPVGSKWQLFIPPDLAYGPRGAGTDIGPNATLVFEVELLSIEPKSH